MLRALLLGGGCGLLLAFVLERAPEGAQMEISLAVLGLLMMVVGVRHFLRARRERDRRL